MAESAVRLLHFQLKAEAWVQFLGPALITLSVTYNDGYIIHIKRREQVKFVAPPKEMLLAFLIVQFLTNYDVTNRKQ